MAQAISPAAHHLVPSRAGGLAALVKRWLGKSPRPCAPAEVPPYLGQLLYAFDAAGWRALAPPAQPRRQDGGTDWTLCAATGTRWPMARSNSLACGPGDLAALWARGRLQDLPLLALAYHQGGDARLPREFRTETLDFIRSNPVGMGPHWMCVAEAAIRAANLLLARDLFAIAGHADFGVEFGTALAGTVLDHGRFIAAQLDWQQEYRGHHALAALLGLLMCAAALPASPETDGWLAFAARALSPEIERQFLPDGGHFEASTGVHLFAAETAIHAAALVLGLPRPRQAAISAETGRNWKGKAPMPPPSPVCPPLTEAALERLARAARFAADLTTPAGAPVRIGDDPPARLFALTGSTGAAPLIAAARGLFDMPQAAEAGLEVHTEVVRWLANGLRPAQLSVLPDRVLARSVNASGPAKSAVEIAIVPPDDKALNGMATWAYPDFGVFLWRSGRALVAIRCGALKPDCGFRHAHNDQLAVEIEIDGVTWTADPGAPVSLADPARRDGLRSALAHFAPRHGADEPARLLAPFALEDKAKAAALVFDRREFLGVHSGFALPIFRRVEMRPGVITITDSLGGPSVTAKTPVRKHVVRSPQELAALWGIALATSGH